mmetsp:Transcript_24883/g.80506  ORF Transcript_24883/g.80506 Transcript_24883/m.80506 type:complete len:339 (-) Transcript_24883:161-1177(-)
MDASSRAHRTAPFAYGRKSPSYVERRLSFFLSFFKTPRMITLADTFFPQVLLRGHHRARVSAVVALGGRFVFASGGFDKTVRLWDAAFESAFALRHDTMVYALAACGTTLATASDAIIRLYDLAATPPVLLRRLRGHDASVYSLAVVDDRRLASGSNDRTAKVWDVDTGTCLSTLEGHANSVDAVAAFEERDGAWHVLTGSWDKTAKLFDLRSNTCRHTLRGHHAWVRACASVRLHFHEAPPQQPPTGALNAVHDGGGGTPVSTPSSSSMVITPPASSFPAGNLPVAAVVANSTLRPYHTPTHHHQHHHHHPPARLPHLFPSSPTSSDDDDDVETKHA